VYWRQTTITKDSVVFTGKEVLGTKWEMVEFRKYPNETRFKYYVNNKEKNGRIKWEDIETLLKKDGQVDFKMNEKQMNEQLSGYTLRVQGIDCNEESDYMSLYEIRQYPGNVYKKYRRGKLTEMDANIAALEIESVNADLKEISARPAWRDKVSKNQYSNESLSLFLEACWREIDALVWFERENERLNGVGVVGRIFNYEKQPDMHDVGIWDEDERKIWKDRSQPGWKGTYRCQDLLNYLEELWSKIDSLRKFKYQNEYLRGRGHFERVGNFQGLNISDLLTELKGLYDSCS
jgi:hypothetical protein